MVFFCQRVLFGYEVQIIMYFYYFEGKFTFNPGKLAPYERYMMYSIVHGDEWFKYLPHCDYVFIANEEDRECRG